MKRTLAMPKGPQYQRGISLIEVLITVLILAIGLLGLSALQLSSLKNNQSAMQRSVAVLQSYTIVEAIRAEPEMAKRGDFNISFNSKVGSGSFPAEIHKTWRKQLQETIGASAVGEVDCKLRNKKNICKITIKWTDKSGLDDGIDQDYPDMSQVCTEVYI